MHIILKDNIYNVICKGSLPVTRRYVVYSPGTATRAQPEGRCQVNMSHPPEGQVNNLLIFHIGEVFSQTLQFIPKSFELKSIVLR